MSFAHQLASAQTPTFRDPQGTLYRDENRILREIHLESAQQVLLWVRSPVAERWVQQRRLVATRVLSAEPGQPLLLEHERIFFPSYPWEWTPGQWLSAASLTLDLCEESLDAGYILKDASPLNVLFSGAQPIFVDVPSFELRDPASALWLAYAQFVRTFLLPLAAYVHLGWPLSASVQRRDGYEPADLAPWLGFPRRWRKPLRSLVTLPLLFQNKRFEALASPGRRAPNMSSDISTLVLRSTLRSARGRLRSLVPPRHASRWSAYTGTASHYKTDEQSAKQEFVRSTLAAIRPAHVLDVGANTGVYSRIAVESGASVVAWDTDVHAADLNWQAAHRDKLPILPLVADFARPTPAVGWRNSECASLLSRAAGRFDCVLMLGILHHLLLTDQIPLAAILDQLAEITTHWAILEWIPRHDSQFSGLCRGREPLYAHLDESFFTQTLAARFAVRAREQLSNGRTLWFVEKTP